MIKKSIIGSNEWLNILNWQDIISHGGKPFPTAENHSPPWKTNVHSGFPDHLASRHPSTGRSTKEGRPKAASLMDGWLQARQGGIPTLENDFRTLGNGFPPWKWFPPWEIMSYCFPFSVDPIYVTLSAFCRRIHPKPIQSRSAPKGVPRDVPMNTWITIIVAQGAEMEPSDPQNDNSRHQNFLFCFSIFWVTSPSHEPPFM